MSQNTKYFSFCIALSLLLCLVQIMGNSLLVLGCLGAYLLLLGWSCIQNRTLLVLLYFLPWAPILKTGPTSHSFYTFGLVLICCISILRNKLWFKKYTLVSGIVILFLTLLSKLLDGYGLEFSFIAFIMMILVLPSVKEEYRNQTYDFYRVNLFFASGIIIAALCAMEYADFPNIAKYIRVDAYQQIVRRCGFYSDANFYVAQINAALSGSMLLLLRENNRKKLVLLIFFIGLLLYCGALSGSKSFVVVTACTVVIWVIDTLRMKRKTGFKIFLLLTMAMLGVYIVTSDLFRELITVLETRFSGTGNLDDLTTGRVELWRGYTKELFGNGKVLLLGNGFTNVKLDGRASHNTILQLIYQFGIAGALFLIYWSICFLRDGPTQKFGKKGNLREIFIVILGVYLPWMALDMLFFDDFFLLQWYLFTAYHATKNINAV